MSEHRRPAHAADFELGNWSVAFKDRRLEASFQRQELPVARASLRVATTFFCVAFLTISLFHFGLSGERPAIAVLCAWLVSVLSAAFGLYAVHVCKESVCVVRCVATIVETIGIGTFLLTVWQQPPDASWTGLAMCVILFVVYVLIPNSLLLTQALAALSTALFLVVAASVERLSGPSLSTLTIWLVLANSAGVIAARRHHKSARDQYRAYRLLSQLSIRDHLTGCFNRRYLDEVLLSTELDRCRRHQHCLGAILCDIDHFKAVNDSYGHASGDTVLQKFASILLLNTRQHVDSVVRYGGEEFLVLLPDTTIDQTIALAERFRRLFEASRTAAGHGCDIGATASFGVACTPWPVGDEDWHENLIVAADAQLYRAKRNGRNQVQATDAAIAVDTMSTAPTHFSNGAGVR
ncbi:GGDEF domain-containing protein [Paraburkholderia bryophila]|uniref:diguanylate cyclase n=1 Tax=Paraburkholderia bryophila TaxID=420952 RepID=A0A7Y9WHW5_9BURK|nr:GGDEF domain-containing protein [Paraburkholderia bryophila]NYH21032.1 diguanylate cyclase (GGDEF)-like protein [Paraburkholderia bryophila]